MTDIGGDGKLSDIFTVDQMAALVVDNKLTDISTVDQISDIRVDNKLSGISAVYQASLLIITLLASLQ